MKASTVSIVVATLFLLVYNAKIWAIYTSAREINDFQSVFELFTFGLFLFFLLLSLFSLVAFKGVQKTILLFVFISASIAMYFSNTLNVYFDTDMIANIFETDYREATELIVQPLLMFVLFLGVLPSLLLLKAKIQYQPFRKQLIQNAMMTAGSLSLAVLAALPHYATHSSFVRANNIALLGSILPSSYIKSTYSYAKKQWKFNHRPEHQQRKVVDASPEKNAHWNEYKRPLALVFIVGETSRAKSFSLQDEASPNLKDKNLVYFSNFSSCGTNTVISVPCMFLPQTKTEYTRNLQYQYENILDIAVRGGIHTTWFDNLNGCKGLCEKVKEERPRPEDYAAFYHDEQFYDEVLVENLAASIAQTEGDQFRVLHQMGSHGPGYYLRIPERFIQHQPACLTEDFSQCSQEAIQNTYLDTVRYTEFVISKAIEELKKLEATHDTALVYVSDHGESTGEMGLYLHGIPWMLAPEEQTHVPALLWFSDSYIQSRKLDMDCLASERDHLYSHDNISHTVLSMLDIDSTVYRSSLDILSPCRASISNQHVAKVD